MCTFSPINVLPPMVTLFPIILSDPILVLCPMFTCSPIFDRGPIYVFFPNRPLSMQVLGPIYTSSEIKTLPV